MYDNKPNNQPAFPTRTSGEDPARPDLSGMELRDYFAAKAMQGLIQSHGLELCADIENGIGSRVSKCSYILADEMLNQREN